MRVDAGKVTAFQDKPAGNLEEYNSYWGCYGFQKHAGAELYRFLLASVRHKSPVLAKQSFFPPAIIPVASYHDLGTWENIESFILMRK